MTPPPASPGRITGIMMLLCLSSQCSFVGEGVGQDRDEPLERVEGRLLSGHRSRLVDG